MRNLFTIVPVLLFIVCINSCENTSESGNLYITDQTYPGTEIITLKILKQTDNQSSEKNIFLDFKDKISYAGYSWYVYDVSEGSWDIYIEYYQNKEFRNERESIYIDGNSSGNAWAAFWPIDNTIYNIWTEQGSGDLKLTNSFFN